MSKKKDLDLVHDFEPESSGRPGEEPAGREEVKVDEKDVEKRTTVNPGLPQEDK